MDKATFQEIAAAVEAVSGVRWVDFDLGQFEDENPPVSFPSVLIGFDSATFTDLSGSAQQGTLVVSVRVAFQLFERTHSKNDSTKRNAALAHLDTLQNIHAALQSLSGTNFSALSRIGYENEKRADLRVYRMTYSTLVTDDGGGSDGDSGNTPTFVPWDEIPTDAPGLCMDIDIPDPF